MCIRDSIYRVAWMDILGSKLLVRFLRLVFLRHFGFGLIHAASELLTFPLYGCGVYVVFLEFMEKLHCLVRIFFGFFQYLMSFFIGLLQDSLLLCRCV